MSLVTLRPKGQLTIPANILQQWNVKPYDQLDVTFQNGVITIMPVKRKEASKKDKLKTFAGVGRGCWGDTPDDVKATISELRHSWAKE